MIEVVIVLTVAVGIGVAMRFEEAPKPSSPRRRTAASTSRIGDDRSAS